MKARIEYLHFREHSRIIAVSDIHGNLPYLDGLLEKIEYTPQRDILVIVGDLLEKGPESLATLRRVLQLQRRGTVLAVCGNCDGWHEELLGGDNPNLDCHVREYMNFSPIGRNGLLAQMCREAGVAVTPDMDMTAMKEVLRAQFKAELDFLSGLPHVLQTSHYTFVHGGLPGGDPETWSAFACMKNDNFMNQGRQFDQWVIVGHWPVVLYGGDIVCANPVIDRESRIISIDGGCVLKDDGQLNALIIPQDGSEDFQYDYYDPFPVRKVKTAQSASTRSAYIRWGDNRVRVLQSGPEFSLCEHIRTGYRLEILSKYLCRDAEGWWTNDCTDYVLPLQAGDLVSVVEETSRGFLVKHRGVSGWYYGQLE